MAAHPGGAPRTHHRRSDGMLNPDGHPILARTLDVIMSPLASVRGRVVPLARGRVLEVGIGTGANLPLYGDIEHLTGLEPDPHMRARAAQRAADRSFPVELVDADAAALPFADGSFDTVVATFVLCTIPDAAGAARELHRVLRPDGLLIYAEHTCAHGSPMRRAQQLVTPVWKRLAGGCHLDRDGLALLRDAGFTLSPMSPERPANHPLPVHYGVGRPG